MYPKTFITIKSSQSLCFCEFSPLERGRWILAAKVIRQNISSLHYLIFDKICKYINIFHLNMILSLFTTHFIDFAQNTSPTERRKKGLKCQLKDHLRYYITILFFINSANLIKIRSFDPLPQIATKGSNETPYKG